MKQSKLRRRRVFRYAILYFVLLVVFVGIIVAPSLLGQKITKSASVALINDLKLMQPNNQDHDNTRGDLETGVKRPGYDGVGTASKTTAATPAETDTSAGDDGESNTDNSNADDNADRIDNNDNADTGSDSSSNDAETEASVEERLRIKLFK
jgi:hypothetical protein